MDEKDLRDCWGTPPEFLFFLKSYFKAYIDTDVCASREADNGIVGVDKCLYIEDGDSLKRPWGAVNWCNPGYSNPTPWLKKAVSEMQKNENSTFMLLKCDPSTRWWTKYAPLADRVVLLTPRIKFICPPGLAQKASSPPFASALFIFRNYSIGYECEYSHINWREAVLNA